MVAVMGRKQFLKSLIFKVNSYFYYHGTCSDLFFYNSKNFISIIQESRDIAIQSVKMIFFFEFDGLTLRTPPG